VRSSRASEAPAKPCSDARGRQPLGQNPEIMRSMPPRVVALALVLACSGLRPALAQEVGRFALVQNEVASLKPGAADAVPAIPGMPVLLDESETTGAGSAAKLTFGEGAVISLGQLTTFRVTRQVVDEATGASVSVLDMLQGKMRIFVSRFWSGRPEVRVQTPSAVVGVKGSEAVVEVLRDGRTVVTVMSGEVTVERRGGGARPIVLRKAQQVRLWADGSPVADPAILPAASLEELWGRTEPDPAFARPLPAGLPTVAPPAAADWQAQNAAVARARRSYATATSAPASQSGTMNDPAATVVPFFFLPQRGGVRPPDQPPGGQNPPGGTGN